MRCGIGFLAVVSALCTGLHQARAQVPALGCDVADFSMALRLYMPLDGSGSPGGQPMQGTLDIHHQKVPKDRRSHVLDGKRPSQFWNRDGQLKLLLVLGAGDDTVTLVIEAAQQQSGGEHVGNFRLTASGVKLSGRIGCAVG